MTKRLTPRQVSLLLLGLTVFVSTTNAFSAPRRKSVSLNVATIVEPPMTDTVSQPATIPVAPIPSKLVMDEDGYPKLGSIAKNLPKDTFVVDTKTSLFYFAADVLAVAGSMGFLNAVVNSDIYQSLPFWQQAPLVLPLQILTGFTMWYVNLQQRSCYGPFDGML